MLTWLSLNWEVIMTLLNSFGVILLTAKKGR